MARYLNRSFRHSLASSMDSFNQEEEDEKIAKFIKNSLNESTVKKDDNMAKRLERWLAENRKEVSCLLVLLRFYT